MRMRKLTTLLLAALASCIPSVYSRKEPAGAASRICDSLAVDIANRIAVIET